MCFSATASFSAGAVLLGLGTLTLKSAHRPRELPFAAIPLLFAIQQLSEGVIWLTFGSEAPLLNTVMTHVYSFFSHVLWPIYVPVAVLLIETARVATVSAARVRRGRSRSGAVSAVLPGGFSSRLAAHRSAHRVRLAAFFCGSGNDAVPAVDHRQPDSVHAPNGSDLRCSGAVVLCRSLLLLCDLVHLGVVLLRRADERSCLPSLCIAARECNGPRRNRDANMNHMERLHDRGGRRWPDNLGRPSLAGAPL